MGGFAFGLGIAFGGVILTLDRKYNSGKISQWSVDLWDSTISKINKMEEKKNSSEEAKTPEESK